MKIKYPLGVIALIERFKRAGNIYILFPAILIGVLAGVGAWFMHFLLDIFGQSFEYLRQTLEQQFYFPSWLAFISIPALGGLLAGLFIYLFAREAKGHGVPEVMLAVLSKGGKIRPVVGLVKAITAAFTIASGGSAGNEGPIVQIGAAIGSTIGQFFRVSTKYMRTYVACGAAGGIAAAFNAPIAGMMFATEIILGELGFAQLTPIVISAVIATVCSHLLLGDKAFFNFSLDYEITILEFPGFIALGLIAAILSIIYTKVLYKCEDVADEIHFLPPYIKPLIGGLMVGCIGLYFPQVMGIGTQFMEQIVLDDLTIGFLLLLLFMKLTATSITLASGGSGGVFAPSLFMGLITGKLVGMANVRLWNSPTDYSPAFALVGMAAVVGATTHAPITAFMIIFELTNDYRLILPLMISTVIAVTAAYKLMPESIYTMKLIRRGINIREGIEQNLLKKISAKQAILPCQHEILSATPLKQVIEIIQAYPHTHYPIITQKGYLEGMLSATTIKSFLAESEDPETHQFIIAEDAVNAAENTIDTNATLYDVLEKLRKDSLSELYVVSGSGDEVKILGVVEKSSVLDAYYQHLTSIEAQGDIAQGIRNNSGKLFSVASHYAILEIETPKFFNGKNLVDLRLRDSCGVDVLLVKRETTEGMLIWQPSPKEIIKTGDSLIILGSEKFLKRIAVEGNSSIKAWKEKQG